MPVPAGTKVQAAVFLRDSAISTKGMPLEHAPQGVGVPTDCWPLVIAHFLLALTIQRPSVHHQPLLVRRPVSGHLVSSGASGGANGCV